MEMKPPVEGVTRVRDETVPPDPRSPLEAAASPTGGRFSGAWRQWVGSLSTVPAAADVPAGIDTASATIAEPQATAAAAVALAATTAAAARTDDPAAPAGQAARPDGAETGDDADDDAAKASEASEAPFSLVRTAADRLLALANIARFEWDLPSGRIGWVVVPIHDETLASVDHLDALLRQCHPRDLERLKQDMEAHVQGRQAVARSEFRLRSVRGTWRWYALCGRIVDLDAGEPRRFAGLIQDIDERRRAMQVRSTQDALFADGPVRLFTIGDGIGTTVRETYAELAALLGEVAGLPHHLSHRSGPEAAQAPEVDAAGTAAPRRLRDIVHAEDVAALREGVETARRRPGQPTPLDLRVADGFGGWRRVRLQLAAEREVSDSPERTDGPQALHAYLLEADDPAMAPPPRDHDDQLHAAVTQLGRMQRFLQELQRLNEMLQLCDGEAQARSIVAQAAASLFPAWDGSVRLADVDAPHAAIVEWSAAGGPQAPTGESAVDVGVPLAAPELHRISFPLVVGTQHGVLEMGCRRVLDEAELRNTAWAAASFAESIGLSLGNVRLREQAVQDWLTGLYNRRWFDEALRRESRRAQRSGEGLTLAILDIDHFKSFNDAFGHDAGDEVLRAVAREMLAFGRASDTPCRIGGEELAVLMPNARIEDAWDRLEELRLRIASLRLHHEGVALPPVTVSIGVADCADGRTQNLQRRADVALYAAKHGGRDNVRCWEPGMDDLSGFAPLGDKRPSSLGI
jgi:diguanylate cyclase (GGDEF)-like protein